MAAKPALIFWREVSPGWMNAPIGARHLLPAWEQFRSTTGSAPIRGEAHGQRMTAMREAAAGDENHPAMGLADIVGDLIADCAVAQHPRPGAPGVAARRILLVQHGLKQGDLVETRSSTLWHSGGIGAER